jgi:hypothetical protein
MFTKRERDKFVNVINFIKQMVEMPPPRWSAENPHGSDDPMTAESRGMGEINSELTVNTVIR